MKQQKSVENKNVDNRVGMLITPDLSTEFYPQPKPNKKVKMPAPVKQVGKKTQGWTDLRELLKERFYKAKITTCELRLDKCWKNTALGFAHLEKRRKLNPEDLHMVVLACGVCHEVVERKPAEEMKKILQDVINRREVQP